MNTFSGKIVWITGASSGIGEALSYAFNREGAQLILSARRLNELERVRAKCSNPAFVELLALDLEHTDELPDKVAWVIHKFRRIDILVNNAGISHRSIAVDTSMQVNRKIMEVDFFGTIALSAAVLPHFLERNEGQFITISSFAGKFGLPLRSAYCAAKHALEGYFNALRAETWKTNLRFLMVRPGTVRTAIAQRILKGDGTYLDFAGKMVYRGVATTTVASSILKAAKKNRKICVIGSFREKLFYRIGMLMPSIVYEWIKKDIS